MMTNLFSTFDPCTGLLSMNWMSMTLLLTTMNYNFWTNKNNMKNISYLMINKMNKEIKMIMPYKGSTLMFMSMFIMILMNNLTGMLPYVFTAPSHLVFSLSMALPLWMMMMTYGWINKTNSMFTHLVPTGTPTMLMPFMIIIETISNMIRPGSLAVRLTANMIAGHLLMSLMGSSMNLIMVMLLMIMFVTLMMFEMAVSIIQAYVFMTLSTLYSSEI